MSGHSKWSTIKHKKAAKDITRGKLFSKLGRGISIAVKTGGGPDPASNHKLRVAIEAARAANMPKTNIERAISKASEAGNLEEVTYEGFAPEGVGVLVETATDNRNRTSQEMKAIFERGGGSMAGPGAVSFNFEPKGLIHVKKGSDAETQLLTLIDLGVEDAEESGDIVEVYTEANLLSQTKDKIDKEGFEVTNAELVQKPKTLQKVSNEASAKKTIDLLQTLEDHDDVQKVFANVDIDPEILDKVG